MKYEKIDNDLFIGKFNGAKSMKFGELEETSFFNNLSIHNEFLASLVSKDVLNETEIYPPNVAVMDFMFKNCDKNTVLLDYGCGIPKLMQLLNHVGYKNVYNYDNWSQVDKKFALEFMNAMNLDETRMYASVSDVPEDIQAVAHIGYPITIKDYSTMIDNFKNLKYIFSDFRFTPAPLLKEEEMPTIKFEEKVMHVSIQRSDLAKYGFEPICIYDGLLVVYKRNGNKEN